MLTPITSFISGYRANPCKNNLSQLVDAEIVTSRDPRLSLSLSDNSIYLQTCSVVKNFGAFDDSASFNSEDWYSEDVSGEFVSEGKTLKVKMLVNSKYMADIPNIDPPDSDVNLEKIVCSKDTSMVPTGGRDVPPGTGNNTVKELPKQNNARSNEPRDCKNKKKRTETAKTSTDCQPRKKHQRRQITSVHEGVQCAHQDVATYGKQKPVAVKSPEEQKKQRNRFDVRTSKQRQRTETYGTHRDKQHEFNMELAEFGRDVIGSSSPKGDASFNKSPMINSDNEPERRRIRLRDLPARATRQHRVAHQKLSKKHQCAHPDELDSGSTISGNKTVSPRGGKRSLSLDRVNSQKISAHIDHPVDKYLVSANKDCRKVCVKPRIDNGCDKVLPEVGHIRVACSSDNVDVCANSRRQRAASVDDVHINSPVINRRTPTRCDARIHHERAVYETGAKHSQGNRQHIPVIMSTTGDSNVSHYKSDKTQIEDGNLVSEDHRSTAVDRRFDRRVISCGGVKQRPREEICRASSLGVDKSDRHIRMTSWMAPKESSRLAVYRRANQRHHRDVKVVRRRSNWHATVQHVRPLSGFVEYCLHKQHVRRRRWTHDKIKSRIRTVVKDMERVCKGRDTRSVTLVTPINHLSVLSLPTELEASYIESPFVKKLHLQALREWMAKKPLDMMLLGKGQPLTDPSWSLPAISQTDDTVTGCAVEFFDDMFHLLRRGSCGSDDVQDLYPEPCSVTQETVHHVFRQVRHYMEFLAKKPLLRNNAGKGAETTSDLSKKLSSSKITDLLRAHERSTGDGQANQNESCDARDNSATRVKSFRRLRQLKYRRTYINEDRIDVRGCGDGPGPVGTREIPLESESSPLQHDPRTPGKKPRLRTVDDRINGILDEFYVDVDEMLDVNSLNDLRQQRPARKPFAKHLPRGSQITKHLMKMAVATDRNKHSAMRNRTNDKPSNCVLENGMEAVTDSGMYSPTQPTGYDDFDLILPEIRESSLQLDLKLAKRKTMVDITDGKFKKRKTKTASHEDAQFYVETTSKTVNKRRYSDTLSEEIIQLNVEQSTKQTGIENSPQLQEKQSAVGDKHVESVKHCEGVDESKPKSAESVTAHRMVSGKDETHMKQMMRFRRQLQSRRTCFLDSYLSSSGDLLGYTPVSNFDNSFDQTCSPHEYQCNPYVLSGPMLQYFLEPHETQLTSHVARFCPSPTQFSSENLQPENSFMWSLALNKVKPIIASPEKSPVVEKDALTDTHEPPAEERTEAETVTDMSATLLACQSASPIKKSAPMKQGNRLMQAFRQAVEAKKRAKTSFSTKAATRVLTKLNAEKRPPPKAAITLFKPPIAFTLMHKSREAASRAEAIAARIEAAAASKENDGNRFAVTLPEMSQVNSVAQHSFDTISRQLEHALATDYVSPPVNGIAHQDPGVIRRELTVRHLSSLSSTATRIYRTNRNATRDDPDQTTPNGVSLNNMSEEMRHLEKSRFTRFSGACPVTNPTQSPLDGTTNCSPIFKNKLMPDTTKNETPVALSFDVNEDHDHSDDLTEHADEESLSKRSMYQTEKIDFDEDDDDDDSKAALMKLQKLGRTSGNGLLNGVPTATENTTTSEPHSPGPSQAECEQRTNAIVQPSVATLDMDAMAQMLDTQQDGVKEDVVAEPTVSPLAGPQICTVVEQQATNAYGSPVVPSECNVGEPGGTSEKFTPTRNKLLQAFRQAVAAKNRASPDKPVKALAKQLPTQQSDGEHAAAPAKQKSKVTIDIAGMASHKGGSVVHNVPEVNEEDEAGPQLQNDGCAVLVECDNAGVARELDFSELYEEESGDSATFTESVTNSVVVSRWPPPQPVESVRTEVVISDPSVSSGIASSNTVLQSPSPAGLDTIPLPSVIGQPAAIIGTASSLPPGPSTVPPLPHDLIHSPVPADATTPLSHCPTYAPPLPPDPATPLSTCPTNAPPVHPSPTTPLPSDPFNTHLLLPDPTTPLPPDTINPPPLPPEPATPLPPDPSTAPPLPPTPGPSAEPPLPPTDPSVAPPLPADHSTTDEAFVPTNMPWMTGEPSEHDQKHLLAMSSFLQQQGRTDTDGQQQQPQDTNTGCYTDSQYPPYDMSHEDLYAYWCQQYYSQVDPYAWGWGQWGAYWSHWQQQPHADYANAWMPQSYLQQWSQPPATYSRQTTGSTRRFLLPTPDSSQFSPWGEPSCYPATGAAVLQGGDAEMTPAADVMSPVLSNKTRMYVLNRDRLVCKSIEVSQLVVLYIKQSQAWTKICGKCVSLWLLYKLTFIVQYYKHLRHPSIGFVLSLGCALMSDLSVRQSVAYIIGMIN